MSATAQRPAAETSRSSPTLSDNLSWLLSQASHVISTEVTAAFDELGFPARGYCVLSAARTGEFTQKELAEMVGLDKTTMVVTIDELERAGLAERRPSEADRRARIIVVTKAGEDAVVAGEKVSTKIQEDVLSSLPQKQRDLLMDALSRLVCDRLSTPATCQRAPRRRN